MTKDEYFNRHGYNRYEVITQAYGEGLDEKQNTITLAEAKALVKFYIKEQNYDSAAIFDFKREKLIALYNGFNQDVLSEEYRNDNARIYWIEKGAEA